MKPYKPKRKTLNAAATNGDIESIMYHLLMGADIDQKLANGHCALGGAVFNGHAQAVQFLIERGAKIDQTSACNWSPLYIAAWRNDLVIAKLLLDAGADIEVATALDGYGNSPFRYTALHWAAERGWFRMTKLLLKYGANPKVENGHGVRPETLAREAGFLKVARMLRDACSRNHDGVRKRR